MNKRTKLVLTMLKPKTKALGFSKKELESAAATIADNLELEDDASDEDVNEAIESGITSAIPFLKLSQSAASRAIQSYKSEHSVEPEDDDDTDEPEPVPAPRKDKQNKETENSALKQLLDEIKGLKSEVQSLKSGKVTDTRKGKLTELLKDTGTYGKSILKSFDKMKDMTDEEFDEYYEDVEADLASINQERADKGLETLGAPEVGDKGNKSKVDKVEAYTDAELDDLADGM